MPIPRLDDAIIEYAFSSVESISARTLDPLKIAWIQTKYSRLLKEKATKLMPEDITLSLSYVQSIAELEGRLSMLQEFLDDHKSALRELNEVKLAGGSVEDTNSQDALAKRASQLVNR